MVDFGKNSKEVSYRKVAVISWPFFLAFLVFISTRLAIRKSGEVEHYYSTAIYPVIARLLSFFSKLIPFSLWDIFWILIIVLIISGLVLVILKKIKFTWYSLRILQTLAILYSLFYLVWGYNYFRPRIQERLTWKIPESDEPAFRSVFDTIITRTNLNYIPISSADFPEIDNLIEKSYRLQSPGLGIPYPNGFRRPKRMIFSRLYGKMGLSGYFGPFFNEIHVNGFLLPMDYPFLLGHEKAHQFGITSEAEANLVSFIICVTSEDQRLRYSGYQSLLLYFLRDASHLKEYKDYLKKIDKPVMDDLQYRQKYYEALLNNTLSDMQTAANNEYLKANNIEKGVKNYNQVVSLVISWYYNKNLNKDYSKK
jgi:hypothetical protein